MISRNCTRKIMKISWNHWSSKTEGHKNRSKQHAHGI